MHLFIVKLLPPQLPIFLIALCVKMVGALKGERKDKGIKPVTAILSGVLIVHFTEKYCISHLYVSQKCPNEGQRFGSIDAESLEKAIWSISISGDWNKLEKQD